MCSQFWQVYKDVATKYDIYTALVLAEFLSKEALLKKKKMLFKESWFYFNVSDLESNLSIGRSRRRKCVKNLTEAQFLKEKTKNLLNRTHYKIHHSNLGAFLSQRTNDPTSEVTINPTVPIERPHSKVVINPTVPIERPHSGSVNNPVYIDINKIDKIDRLDKIDINSAFEILKNLWNSTLPKNKKVLNLGKHNLRGSRRSALRCMIKSYPDLESWKTIINLHTKSSFLQNGNGTWTGSTFDWILKEKNWLKISEGNYTDKNSAESEASKKQAQMERILKKNRGLL